MCSGHLVPARTGVPETNFWGPERVDPLQLLAQKEWGSQVEKGRKEVLWLLYQGCKRNLVRESMLSHSGEVGVGQQPAPGGVADCAS